MPLDFPNSPTNGQTYTGPNNAVWQWDGAKWVAGYGAATAYAPISSPAFTGDPTAPTPAAGDADASLATTAFVAAAVAPDRNNVGRNLLHNGLFKIQQRGFSFPNVGTPGFTFDRWKANPAAGDSVSVSAAHPTPSEVVTVGDEDFYWLMSNNITGTASGYLYLSQTIEDVRRLAGKTVTISFWSNAAPNLKIGINMMQDFGSGGSPSGALWVLPTGLSVTSLIGWQRFSVTIAVPSIAGKTVGTDGNHGTWLAFFLSGGSGIGTLAGNIGVQSGTINFWGVQLEVGTVATPLEKPDPQVDLANCQRFYQNIDGLQVAVGAPAGGVYSTSPIVFPVAMRAVPTAIITGQTYGNGSGLAVSPITKQVAQTFMTAASLGNAYCSYNASFAADL